MMHSRCLRRFASAALMLLVGVLASTGARAQDPPYVIQGTVLDAGTRQPLASASVLVRGAGQERTAPRTVTDAAGRFTLRAPLNPGTYTLEISLVGRGTVSRPLTLGANRTVQVAPVSLTANALELDELVVTGSGVTQERRAVANRVETVRGEAINNAPAATTIDQALQGKITGALITQNTGQPGGGVSIRLRGTNSILGGAEPLIVLDGVLIDNNADALISLSANAGRQGAALSNRLADILPGDIERIEVLKGAAAAALYGSRANNGVIQIFTKRGLQGRPQVTFRTEVAGARTPGRYNLNMSPYAGLAEATYLRRANGARPVIGDTITRFDIQDSIFRTGYSTTSQLSVAGGSEASNYYLSGSYANEEGIIEATGRSNVNVRGRFTQRLSDQFDVTANATYIRSETNYIPEGEQTQGALTTILFTPTGFSPFYDPDLGRYPTSPVISTNPLQVIRDFRAVVDVDRFIGSFQASYAPTSNLTFRYLFGLDNVREEDTYFQPALSAGPNFTGLYQNPIRTVRKYNNDLTASHVWDPRSELSLNTNVGFRHTYDETDVLRAGASDLSLIPLEVLSGATQFASQGITELSTIGGFIQEQIGFRDRLFVTAGLNVDASSAFGADERLQFFPRLGVSYLALEGGDSESRFGRLLSTLKLRAAYGETGGQPPGAYVRFDNYFNTAGGGKPGILPSSVLGNPNLRPERQREFEGGFDMGLFGNRVELAVTAYDKETSDLVLAVPLALSTGFSSQFQNIGVLSNRGLEVELNTINVQSPGFSWRSRLSYATNKEEVERLVARSDTIVVGYLNVVTEGQPVGAFYGRVYQRDANGNIVINPATGFGNLAADTIFRANGTVDRVVPRRQIIGNPNPDFIASFGNNFAFGRNLELSFLLDGRFGNDVANFSRRLTEFFGTDKVVEDEIERRRARLAGDTTVAPRIYTLNGARINNYEEYVEDGSFVKLREIALGYNFNNPFPRFARAESIGLRIAARNLYTWTNYSGLDPEINLFSSSTVARGVDFANTPLPRTVTVGLTVNF